MTNPNDPAHPQHGWSKDPETLERMKSQAGITKREYFAAMAMNGLIARGPINQIELAEISLFYADALIAELNKDPK